MSVNNAENCAIIFRIRQPFRQIAGHTSQQRNMDADHIMIFMTADRDFAFVAVKLDICFPDLHCVHNIFTVVSAADVSSNANDAAADNKPRLYFLFAVRPAGIFQTLGLYHGTAPYSADNCSHSFQLYNPITTPTRPPIIQLKVTLIQILS